MLLMLYCVALTVVLVALFVRSVLLVVRGAPPKPPIPPPPRMTWGEALGQLGSGDVILVRSENLMALTVNAMARSWFTHVALVVRSPSPAVCAAFGLVGGETTDVFVLPALETTSNGCRPPECDVPELQLMPLAAWRAKYGEPGTRVMWRKLLCRRRDDNTVGVHGATKDALEPCLSRLPGRLYPTVLQMALRRGSPAWVGRWLWQTTAECANCAETVHEVLEGLGVVHGAPNPQHPSVVSPDDFASLRWRHPHVTREIELLDDDGLAAAPQQQQDGQVEVQQEGQEGPARGAAVHALGVDQPQGHDNDDGQTAQGEVQGRPCGRPWTGGGERWLKRPLPGGPTGDEEDQEDEWDEGLAEGTAAGVGRAAAVPHFRITVEEAPPLLVPPPHEVVHGASEEERQPEEERGSQDGGTGTFPPPARDNDVTQGEDPHCVFVLPVGPK